MASKDSSRNLVAAMSYLIFFVTGIVILFVEQEDKFVRFHAFQSTIIFGILFVLNIVVQLIINPLPIIGFLSSIVSAIIYIIWFTVWLVSMYRAYRGQIFKWPIAGNISENQVK